MRSPAGNPPNTDRATSDPMKAPNKANNHASPLSAPVGLLATGSGKGSPSTSFTSCAAGSGAAYAAGLSPSAWSRKAVGRPRRARKLSRMVASGVVGVLGQAEGGEQAGGRVGRRLGRVCLGLGHGGLLARQRGQFEVGVVDEAGAGEPTRRSSAE